eukprot:CAMPEP_0194769812 /NCGR_PEP_ID=MMETSP0323_2-20130528/44326_1 /TAXON_ID=2866 ORGANISM="Crypthecodinium cohnii, Strain Seligo" /NCGR_SAMPLE_ID=MMETSP0323_2 /ASSEMBLY_ACC=CAM_ASM_000346 /LENGTH=32 /DNA_ID= /DNA_START= /DNA_END= /DNA_ORIENTATION=
MTAWEEADEVDAFEYYEDQGMARVLCRVARLG